MHYLLTALYQTLFAELQACRGAPFEHISAGNSHSPNPWTPSKISSELNICKWCLIWWSSKHNACKYVSSSLRPCLKFYKNKNTNIYYYTSDSLWKIWLVESIQSIHNSLWSWHDKCNICCRYCIYHVKFNVCLVTKPLGVFSSDTKWLNASLLFLRMNYVKNV